MWVYALLLVIIVLAVVNTASAITQRQSSNMTDTSNPDNQQSSDQQAQISTITANPGTWPKGDSIWDFCQCVAHAEGADIPNENPDRLNNPGDISDGARDFGYELHSGSRVTTFPDKATGWQWLYSKLFNATSGRSSLYHPQMTIYQFSSVYQTANADSHSANIVWWANNKLDYNIKQQDTISVFAL